MRRSRISRKLRLGLALFAAVVVGAAFPALGDAADLVLTKVDVNDPVTSGDQVVYHLTVQNVAGSGPANDVVLTDFLPAGTTFTFAAVGNGLGTCTRSGNTVTCNLGTLAEGETRLVVVRALVTAGGALFPPLPTISNSALVTTSSPDDVSDNAAVASTSIQAPPPIIAGDVTVTKTDSPDPVTAGSLLTYTITVNSDAFLGSGPVIVTDNLPSSFEILGAAASQGGCTFPTTSSTFTISCDVGVVGGLGGGTVTIAVFVRPTLAGVFDNEVTIASASGDTNTANNTVLQETVVQPGPTAVAVRSFGAAPSKRGVLLRWRTASEVDALGFNVYRSVGGNLVRLNQSLIRARGAGRAYSYLDRKAPRAKAPRYVLEVVNADGSRNAYGPVRVTRT
jgi:uncharacterized repeat protein (TIGR01451 family)